MSDVRIEVTRREAVAALPPPVSNAVLSRGDARCAGRGQIRIKMPGGKTFPALFLCLLGFLPAGCGERTINSSSEEKFSTSIEVVRSSLDEKKKKQFDEAMKHIAAEGVDNLFQILLAPKDLKRKMRDQLAGKTADEVIIRGMEIAAEALDRDQKTRVQVTNEIDATMKNIAKLEQKQAVAEAARQNLKQFSIVETRFSQGKNEFITQPLIELTVKNGTKAPISKAYFEGILSTPGRSVPWIKDSFTYQVKGGLEPGEVATWKLVPNMFGEWGNVPKDRPDMVLTIEVIRIDGVDEKPIFDLKTDKNNDETLRNYRDKLDGLKKLYVELEKKNYLLYKSPASQ